jgi:non-specific serine/threonine protein kinase
MDITLKLIDDIAAPEVVARGRKCFHAGQVQIESATKDFVRALVNGSSQYTVELHRENGHIAASCDCPFQFESKCKHVVAAMFATLYNVADVNIAAPSRRIEQTMPNFGWVSDVKKLLLPAEQRSDAPESQWRVAYSLKIADNRRSLLPIKIRVAKDGSDGQAAQLRNFDLDTDHHFDFVDRAVLERIGAEFKTTIPQQATATSEDEESDSWSQKDRTIGDVLNLLAGKELYLAHQTNLTFRRLHVSAEHARLSVGVNENADGGVSLQPQLEWQRQVFALPVDTALLAIDTLWILFDNNVVRVTNVPAGDFLLLQMLNKEILVPSKDRAEFIEEVLPRLVKRYRVRSNLSEIKTVDATPKPRLYLSEVNDKLNVELRFLYDEIEVDERVATGEKVDDSTRREEIISTENGFAYVHRAEEAEQVYAKRLGELKLHGYIRADGKRNYFPFEIHSLEWLLTKLPLLLAEGLEIYGQDMLRHHRLRTERAKVKVRVSSGIDWFDLSVDVHFGGSRVEYAAFVEAVRRNEQFVKLDDGTFGVLPQQWLKRFKRVLSIGRMEKELFQLSRTHLGLLNDLAENVDEFESDDEFEKLRERLKSFTSIKKTKLPKSFHGELRPYQVFGYDWLQFLREFRVGGVLADDMGLGKTVQTLALLQKIYEDGEELPSLIVVPTTPLFNWQKEIERFTPNLDVMVYAGSDRKELADEFSNHQIVLTSYAILRRDVDVLKEQEFFYVILDESQNIKNAISVNAHAARALTARHRLALSGTPVENNLMELWSQFTFLNPGMLGSERTFAENFAKPIERLADEHASTALKQLIFPFLLRRTKELVATELPQKVESTVYCDMDVEQKRAYEYWRRYFRDSILKSIESVGFQRSKIKVLEGLMRLRQICCHPRLVDSNYAGTSGKFDAFIEMLDDILAEGHKVLVFSQFVKMLDILRRHCDHENIVYEYLDGSTKKRRERVERFQSNENVKLFLISLKAGGTGLNLTAADYVIHYDPWWNPAVEMQATDRTHRIGQTKQVFAYKLITRESVEEKILALQERKQALVKNVITTDSGFMKSLTKEDVEALFR